MNEYRTHTCGQLRAADVGQHVKLAGWIHRKRNLGNLCFVDLRDHYGITQCVFNSSSELFEKIKDIRVESVVGFEGEVVARESVNKNMPTGDIEIKVTSVEVHSEADVLPIQVFGEGDEPEELRLKYRFLDLRRERIHNNIMLRTKVIAEMRRLMVEQGFVEYQTPILTASSPEGARDFLVPSRINPGKFYALPQAPQQFKQLLMVSGFDRYFQVAPCFRDEDARGDRSPGEFYQLDMEMSFATQEDVFAVCEDVLPPIFAKYGKYNIASRPPFRRIPYLTALEVYGSDKPDLRIDLTATNISSLFENSEFEPLRGQTVKAVAISDCTLTRKQIEKLLGDCEVQSGSKGYWFKTDESGELAGGIAKFVNKEEAAGLLALKPNTLVVVAAG